MLKMLNRSIDLRALLSQKSYFLFGARGTGKTKLIEQTLEVGSNFVSIDLLKSEIRLKLLMAPETIELLIGEKPPGTIVIVDEVQKVPEILDEIHRLIEKKGYHFLLTGSNARKLKRAKANLLASRARLAHLFPLTYDEIPNFDIEKYLLYGGVPSIYLSNNPFEDIYSYIEVYIKEEINAESAVRNLPSFARFLKVAALSNGQMLNYVNVGQDAQVAPSTVRDYFILLEDTLIGNTLESFKDSKKRKAMSTSKFYFFDTGVANALAGTRNIDRNSDRFGLSFEHFIYMELKAYNSYRRKLLPITYWRSTSGFEVDFLIDNQIAIEVKSCRRVQPNDTKGLLALKEEGIFKQFYLISFDKLETTKDNLYCLFWENFLQKLWNNEIF